MALSRIALAGALLAAPAAAQPDPVAGALDAQREIVRSAASPDCGSDDAEEIVVCGRSEEEEQSRLYRVPPTPYTQTAADRSGGAQRDAMRLGSERCSTVGRAQSCGGTIPILEAIGLVVRAVQAVRARRD
ncbi:MAG TPA: hypothetical protein VF702_01355 [Allosphingosinicella sp.]